MTRPVGGLLDRSPVLPIYPAGAHLATGRNSGEVLRVWAVVIALADQYAGRDLGFVNPASTGSAAAPTTTRRFTT